jgi:hypothetical protein
MRKWGIVISVSYALILLGLIVPGFLYLSGLPTNRGDFMSPIRSSSGGPSDPRFSQPPPLLHRRILRLTLTCTSARNSIMPRFRRFRRDSRSAVQGQFL